MKKVSKKHLTLKHVLKFQKNAFSVQNMYKDSTTSTYNTPYDLIIGGSTAVSSDIFFKIKDNYNSKKAWVDYVALKKALIYLK